MGQVISVEHLSKQYDLGVVGTGSLVRDFERWWARARHKPDPYAVIGHEFRQKRRGETILALDDVSFTVQKGEALGIIGKNGAGKSTLLKILSRVTAPTSGVLKVKGRIGSLLEVGTGFHPELTGRENIFLNGAILGMKKAEVTRKFDEIVDFSGVEKFIDTPVKRYSSGMYVRLAFAVAAHLDPEILIVDEVLAVGDAEFQKKCLGKMGDVAHEGRTVLFVSHNMVAVNALTKRVIFLESGQISFSGAPDEAISLYLGASENHFSEHLGYREPLSSNDVILTDVAINGKEPPTRLIFGESIKLDFTYYSQISISNACLTVIIKDKLESVLSVICSYDNQINLTIQPGNNQISLTLPQGLSPGFYSFDVAINPSFHDKWLECHRSVKLGEVILSENHSSQSFISPNRLWGNIHFFQTKWDIESKE